MSTSAISIDQTATVSIVNKRTDPFSRVPKTLLADTQLSWKAKGMLAYLIGQPMGWKVLVKDLANRSTDGEDSVRSGLSELIKAGYAQYRQTRTGGKFDSGSYSISDTPIFTDRSPHPDLPDAVKPHPEKPHPENPTLTKNNISKKEFTKKELAAAPPETFSPSGEKPNAPQPQDAPPPQAAAPSPVVAFCAEVETAYKARFQKAYVWNYGKDRAAVKRLLTQVPPEEALAVYKAMLGKQSFWASRAAHDLNLFCCRFSSVRAEQESWRSEKPVHLQVQELRREISILQDDARVRQAPHGDPIYDRIAHAKEQLEALEA